jgi:hypothetical protein
MPQEPTMNMPLIHRIRSALAGAKAFFAAGLWQLDLEALPRWKALSTRLARALMVAGAEFFKDQCMLRASALTFYTLLSIVPVFAVIFGVANFNAIYGSFAALPLFIVWVQTSWTLVLLGAELCFAFENADTYCCAAGCPELTPGERKLLALRISRRVVENFAAGSKPLTVGTPPYDLGYIRHTITGLLLPEPPFRLLDITEGSHRGACIEGGKTGGFLHEFEMKLRQCDVGHAKDLLLPCKEGFQALLKLLGAVDRNGGAPAVDHKSDLLRQARPFEGTVHQLNKIRHRIPALEPELQEAAVNRKTQRIAHQSSPPIPAGHQRMEYRQIRPMA